MSTPAQSGGFSRLIDVADPTLAGRVIVAKIEIAQRVDRDVRAVPSDVHVLLNAGLVERTADGRVHFPYDAIHVDFVLSTAA